MPSIVLRIGRRANSAQGSAGASSASQGVRVAHRILAMDAAIWRNHKTGAPTMRSPVAFDH
ncbi:hypothetical protein OG490_01800 [Streptomyces sp. NBC_00503]|nr:hypothetical protein [Streptomyces sp. NBC_00503]WUD79407.1 hypothetical protein OG490_01800 [Streptomyces sp. NBC_00503]